MTNIWAPRTTVGASAPPRRNPGRMMPGRNGGRMMMPGRRGVPAGGRMMPGRGGGRMMPGRGGGRMMPGRGRGGMMLAGWGGSKGFTGKRIPSKLDVFNRYVGFKITTFLDRDDQENLGRAFPQYMPAPLTPEQQKMRMMKKMQEARAKAKEEQEKRDKEKELEATNDADQTGILLGDLKVTDGPDDKDIAIDVGAYAAGKEASNEESADAETKETYSDANNETTDESSASDSPPENDCHEDSKGESSESSCKLKKDPIEGEAQEVTKSDCDCQECKKKQMDPELRKKMMAAREEQIRINLTDCDTLLAQLNTKRLYQRVKYYKNDDPEYNIDKAYPYNRSTVEISKIEWTALMNEYKVRHVENEIRKRRAAKENRKKELAMQAKKSEHKEDESDSESDYDTDVSLSKIVNFEDLEIEEDDEYEYVGVKPSKYEMLMFTPCPREVAVLASYPRSGNSLMRNLYEKITLRVTGSDMMGGLQKHDLVGEMATGTNNVQFVKTHYPERMGAPAFPVSRAVLLVRNPYDAMDSYFNLMTTSTHTTSLTEAERTKFEDIFAEMAKREVLVWRDFHEYWLKQHIPLLVVRYEDLIRETAKVMTKVIKFVLEIEHMTFFEDRIRRAIGEEQVENLGPYKARSGGVGRSLTKGHYTPELLQKINVGIMDTMDKFGYLEMLVASPEDWKLDPIDKWGVFIPASKKGPMIINNAGLVRGPNRQTNWQRVKMVMDKRRKEEEEMKNNVDVVRQRVDLN